MRDNGINKQKQRESHLKSELKKEKKCFKLRAPLNNSPLNLHEDNMTSIAELRINALTVQLGLGSPQRCKWVNEDSFWLNNILSIFWMLPKSVCFASQYSGQWRKKWFMDSMSPPQIQMGFIVSLKPCLNVCSLKWLKPRRNLVNSFIPYGL